ncbi:hypothetical protein [Marinomonas posidonica]|uniref:hypothetical protein n=1 Tax=Marinomonas posidonica TaxID=936476 RepID=UPI0037370783
MSNRLRELSSQHAFQTQCLAQMGVVTWLNGVENVVGQVYLPAQPWQAQGNVLADSEALDETLSLVSEHDRVSGFSAKAAQPPVMLDPQEKQQSVSNLREQLNAGPEIIVEDLQPIEELAVDIEVATDVHLTQVSSIELRAYALSNRLLILSDVPAVFSQQEEIDQLALKMAQALLKDPVENWQRYAFAWPGTLKNPHFLNRTDWLIGALESSVQRWTQGFLPEAKLVLAGSKIAQLMDDLPSSSPLKSYPMARIVSLSELHRIPELRKEAWNSMQTSFFSSH